VRRKWESDYPRHSISIAPDVAASGDETLRPPRGLADEGGKIPGVRTFDKGNIAEAAWVSFFVRCGYVVLLPFGDGARYDLAVDRGDGPERVQVKTARRIDGALAIPTCSVAPDRRGRRPYTREEIDLLAAYWPDEDRFFLIRVEELPATEIRLRLTPALSGRFVGVRHAVEYEVVAFNPAAAPTWPVAVDALPIQEGPASESN
jgi:hypothetical protein